MKFIWETKTNSNPVISEIRGMKIYSYPLLIVSPPKEVPEPPHTKDTLIFTSRNGVRAFCELTDRRSWPVLCVGDTTAQRAQAAGFGDVQSASGDVTDLQDMIVSQHALKTRRLYYASGKDISRDLVEDLGRKGFKIHRSVLYETHPNIFLPEFLRTAITQESPFFVTLYSPKGARTFASLELDFSRISTVSISDNVDKELRNLRLKDRKVASTPTELGMIKLLT